MTKPVDVVDLDPVQLGPIDLAPIDLGPIDLVKGGRPLVRDIHFQLLPGRYIELRGANGSGKTTLLKILAGLDESLQSHSLSAIPASVFYFAHQSGFRPELNVRDQLALSLQLLGVTQSPDILDTLLGSAGLRRQANLQVRELSHGQHRRLLLLVMASSQRHLWLIDEPLNALDDEAKRLFAELLIAHLQAGGMAIVATHLGLSEAIPALTAFCGGQLSINDGLAAFQPSANTPGTDHATIAFQPGKSITALQALLWSMRREFKLLAARPADIAWPAMFHLMIVSMFPLAVGTGPEILQRIAPGVFWMSAMLAMLMAASRLFEQDSEHGVLVQMRAAECSFAAVSAGKFAASFLAIAVPVALVSYPLGLLYHLPLAMMNNLTLSLLFGLVSLVAFTGLFAALGLMARNAQVVMCLLAFPVFVPLLIFGTSAVNDVAVNATFGFSSPLVVLISLSCLTMLTVPLVTAKVLALAVE